MNDTLMFKECTLIILNIKVCHSWHTFIYCMSFIKVCHSFTACTTTCRLSWVFACIYNTPDPCSGLNFWQTPVNANWTWNLSHLKAVSCVENTFWNMNKLIQECSSLCLYGVFESDIRFVNFTLLTLPSL